jgi:hypothetical protein
MPQPPGGVFQLPGRAMAAWRSPSGCAAPARTRGGWQGRPVEPVMPGGKSRDRHGLTDITLVYGDLLNLPAPWRRSVLDPVPGHPRQRPSQAMITLITCDPPWTGTHRIIVFGTLQAERTRTGPHR